MPRPLNERQSLEQERAEIPGQIAAYRQELENGRPHKARRERLEWQIREREKRLAEVRKRLVAINKVAPSAHVDTLNRAQLPYRVDGQAPKEEAGNNQAGPSRNQGDPARDAYGA